MSSSQLGKQVTGVYAVNKNKLGKHVCIKYSVSVQPALNFPFDMVKSCLFALSGGWLLTHLLCNLNTSQRGRVWNVDLLSGWKWGFLAVVVYSDLSSMKKKSAYFHLRKNSRMC